MTDTREYQTGTDRLTATMGAAHRLGGTGIVHGRYHARLLRADGSLIHEECFDNLLTQTGKAFVLNSALAGEAYTAALFAGLISSVSYTAVSAGDTMGSHAGWVESGATNAPTMSSTRQACVWGAPTTSGSPNYTATQGFSAALSYTFTGSGTVEGAFIVGGSGAVATVGDSGGTLLSAGAFTTAQPVISGNILQLNYSMELT